MIHFSSEDGACSFFLGVPLPSISTLSSPSALQKRRGTRAALWYSGTPRVKISWPRSLPRIPFPLPGCHPAPQSTDFSRLPRKLKVPHTHHLPPAFQHPRRPLLRPQRIPRGNWTLARTIWGRGGNQTHPKFGKVSKELGMGSKGC